MIKIREETAKLLKDEFQIAPETTNFLFDKGLLDFRKCRNMLVRMEYKKKAKPKCKNLIKSQLSNVYCVSVELIEKIVAKKG
jgi:hypothetical protein